MGKTKKRETDEREQKIQQALKAVEAGLEGGVSAAVELYGVPRATLYARISGKRASRQTSHEGQQRLTAAEEEAIVRWCYENDDRGFPPRLDLVQDMARHLERKRTGLAPAPLGKNWITRFLNRHPDLANKYSTNLQRQDAQANRPRLIKEYFAKLARIIRRHGLKAHQIFSMNRKYFLLGMAARAKAIRRPGQQNPRLAHDGNWDSEFVTVVETISAAGLVLAPLIINEGEEHDMDWYEGVTKKQKDYRFSYSSNGQMDDALGMSWLETVFETGTANIRPLPRLLILDNHASSYLSFDFIDYCVQNDILLLCPPPHSAHLLQPLDVGLFGPYQHLYDQAVDDFTRSGRNEDGVTRAAFIPLLTTVRRKAFTTRNIVSAFEATGIWPLCARKVLTKVPRDAARSESEPRDSPGAIASPRSNREIRRKVQVAEQLLAQSFEALAIDSPTAATGRLIIAHVTAIMQELGHQLETEIAQTQLFQEQSRKLQSMQHIYDETSYPHLSVPASPSGAVLTELRDKGLAKDNPKKAAVKVKRTTAKTARTSKTPTRKKPTTKTQKRPRAPKTPQPHAITTKQTPAVIVESGGDEESWADVEVLGKGDPVNPRELASARPRASVHPADPTSPIQRNSRIQPDRPLHKRLRSRKLPTAP